MSGPVDLKALEAWMDGLGLGHGPIGSPCPLTGGTQNILLKFERGDRSYVLRRPPAHPRPESNRTMEREARVLAALAESDVPHPRLIAASDEAGAVAMGVSFYLMEPVEGFNPVVGLPPLHAGSAQLQHRMGLAVTEAIAALGRLDHRAIGLDDFGRPEGFLERQAPRWSEQLASYADFSSWPGPAGLPAVAEIGAWLQANRPAGFTPGVMHGDYHMANVMIRDDGPEVAAIVDWELATIGDPLLDLGWLLATWPSPGEEAQVSVKPWIGFPTADELVAHYAARSTRDMSAMDWYVVLACYKLGILLEGTHARACAGKAPKDIGDRLHQRAVWLFERAAQRVR